MSGPDSPQLHIADRHSLQLARRFLHMGVGLSVGLIYQFFFTHSQIIYFWGAFACVLYSAEQVRLNYPELASKIEAAGQYIFRAKEQFEESAGVPFAMGLLLALISFPKMAALTGIYTLALSDPLAAIVGIKYGRRKWGPNHSVEGSAAFFVATLCAAVFVLYGDAGGSATSAGALWGASFSLALACTLFERIPIRIDDNLTIPLFTAACFWGLCLAWGVPV